MSAAVLNVPTAQYPTIQSAIDAAGTGDEIVVAAGTYSEVINFNAKAITIRSADGPAVTTIDGAGLDESVVLCVMLEGPNSVLEGFTITGGTGNTSFVDPVGGGLFVLQASPTVTRCVFSANSAKFGGGVYVSNGGPTFQSCIFADNNASRDGGAIYSLLSSTTITNCTVYANTAQAFGGVFINESGSVITNSILWGNADDTGMSESAQIQVGSGTPTITYSIVQGLAALATGAGNLGVDPGFVDGPGGDLRLLGDSPAIDAGNNGAQALPTLDLDGLPRRIDDGAIPDTGLGSPPIVDIGAFEAPGDCNGNGVADHKEPDSDGDGLIDPCDNCPDTPPGAVIGAFGCPLIRNVTQNTQFDTIQAAIDASVDGDEILLLPARYMETLDLKGRAIWLHSQDGPDVTIIDASELGGTVVTCSTGEGPDTVLEGVTITGGSAEQGGGMFNSSTSPTILNCVFESNSGNFGGGMYNAGGMPRVVNCAFVRNTVTDAGGGMANVLSAPIVVGCVFRENSADFGGAVYNKESDPTLSGCTIFGNDADLFGGGILNDASGATVTNSILWNNSDVSGFKQSSAQFHVTGGDPLLTLLTFSCIRGGWAGAGGTGNTMSDPRFMDAPGGNFRLFSGSPCIDAGSNIDFIVASALLGVSVDGGGAPRFADDPNTPDTGLGIGMIIDMGAHEFTPPPADFDLSGTVDLFDFAEFLDMFTGPDSP
ncbi:MAG: hypothetical protein IID33_02255 [Planctomycetes bacterium]|nr:hypothetical protein [Planctomycetota bacterium]